MNITFNLQDAKIFIPSGRMGNLTKTIWSKISLSKEEIEVAFNNKNYDFSNISVSTDDLIENHSQKSFSELRSLSKMKIREQFNSFDYNNFIQKHTADILISSMDLISESSKSLIDNQEIKDKLLKLKKLQQFNELNKENWYD